MSIAEGIEREIREIFFREVVSVVISKAAVALPFLGWPVVGWFFSAFVHWMAKRFWDEVKVHGMFLAIDIEEDQKRREYQGAVQDLRDRLKNPAGPDEIEKAKEQYREKLRNLIRIDAAA